MNFVTQKKINVRIFLNLRDLKSKNSSMKKLRILWLFSFILFLGWGCSSDEPKQEEIVEVTEDISWGLITSHSVKCQVQPQSNQRKIGIEPI